MVPCNSTAGRGYPIYCLILDEVGLYRADGPMADVEILNALSPRLSQFKRPKLLLPSTPSAKQGLLWQYFQERDVEGRLVIQASTRFVNPRIYQEFIDRERRRDPENAAREFDAEFAERVSAFFDEATVKAASLIVGDIPPVSGVAYVCGIDASGLAGRDKMSFAIAHRDVTDPVVKIDCLRSWDTTDAETILSELGELCRAYGIGSAAIDNYAKGWVSAALAKHGLYSTVRPALPVVYANLKSGLLARRVEIPDNPELREGLLNTLAFYGRNQTLSIAHPRDGTGHGDLADAVATAVYQAGQPAEAREVRPGESPYNVPISQYGRAGSSWAFGEIQGETFEQRRARIQKELDAAYAKMKAEVESYARQKNIELKQKASAA